jgi:glycosyltransferase involved in cell wall biosynthesis
MKIGIITNLYPPFARGGAENVVVRTVESLIEHGHDVFVITSQPRRLGTEIKNDRNTTERVYRFFPTNLYHTLDDHRYPWILRLVWHVIDTFCSSGANRVKKILLEEQPDAVITHNLKGLGLRIPGAIRGLKIPYVHVVHDLQLIYPSGLLFAGREKVPFFINPFYKIYRVICRVLFGQPNAVVFPSKYLRDVYLAERFFKKTQVLIMPNPAPRFQPVARGERNPGPLKLLFVGQLETHKGIEFLLNAYRQFPSGTHLIVAGEGTHKELVQKRAAADKNIVYLGYISLEQLVNCLGVVDALVVPSLCYENSPTVIYESLNAGVPILAANIGGVGELIQSGVNGYLFEPGSADDLRRVVNQLDAEKDRFSNLQAEIRATVAPHELKTYTQKLVDLLTEVSSK